MSTVIVIDYGMGNLDSVARGLQECGVTPIVTGARDQLWEARLLVLPGVGSFADGMKALRERGLIDVIRDRVLNGGIPLFGICLGMHLLATSGTEGGDTAGLDLIPGRVARLNGDVRVPHVGWNEVHRVGSSAILDGIEDGKDFYFVHSYRLACDRREDVRGVTPYGGEIVSVVERGNVAGVQFHPEKSQRPGLQLLRNVLGWRP